MQRTRETMVRGPRNERTEPGQRAAAATDSRPAGPIIVLTYSYAGGRRLQMLLERQPSLACTVGTGILGACDAAAQTWRRLDDSEDERLSSLAISSIRALASSMLTVITVRSGARRWCEIAAAETSAAETFLQVFPGTRFLCLHRACPDVVNAVLRENPWGITGANFAPYLLQQPVNTASAIAAWWEDFAGPIVAFEAKHPQACMRVRYEDLVLDPDATSAAIFDFIGIAPEVVIPGPAFATESPAEGSTGAERPGAGAGFPVRQMPPQLLNAVNELHAKLGYPTLSVDP